MDKKTKGIIEVLIYVAIIVVVILVKIFVVTPVRVEGASMNNTLKNGDIMILNKLSYVSSDIKRFDIVVVKLPDEDIIKRVIGLPGEKIEYKDNQLYVDGKKVKEKFDKIDDKSLIDYNTSKLGSITVPKGFYFVLGDNRANSSDSRVFGFIPKDRIKGKTSFTIFPFSRFGKK